MQTPRQRDIIGQYSSNVVRNNSKSKSKSKSKKQQFVCEMCKSEFLTKTGWKSHTKDECDEKKHLLEYSTCKDCGRKFESVAEFEGHFASCLWFKSRNSPKPSFIYRQIVATKISPISSKTLIFGGKSKLGSQVGAISFFIVDNSTNFIIVEYSQIVPMLLSSLLRLHFQSLLVGLLETAKLGIRNVEVCGDVFVVSELRNSKCAQQWFNSVRRMLADLIESTHAALQFFTSVQLNEVSTALKSHCELIGNLSLQTHFHEQLKY